KQPANDRNIPSIPTRRSSDLKKQARRCLERRVRGSRQTAHDQYAHPADGYPPRYPAVAAPCDKDPAGPCSWGGRPAAAGHADARSEEHTSELQSREKLVCRLL